MAFNPLKKYWINEFLLSSISFWPNKKLGIYHIVMAGAVIASVILQLTTFITVKYNTKLFLRNAPTMVIAMCVNLKYYTFFLQPDTIKNIVQRLQHHWSAVKMPEELKIMERHVVIANRHCLLFAFFCCQAGATYVIVIFSPQVLDIVIPLNDSRPRSLPVMAEFFIDEEQYFYCLATLIVIAVFIMCMVFIVTEGGTIMVLQHTCSLFDVVWFSIYVKDNFIISYGALLILGVASLSIDLHRAAMYANDPGELATSGFVASGILGYMFYINYMSQQVLDWSNEVFKELARSYVVEWHGYPYNMQKVIRLAMLRSVKTVTYDVCGIFHPSMEGFSLLARMSFSYFMVLRTCSDKMDVDVQFI